MTPFEKLDRIASIAGHQRTGYGKETITDLTDDIRPYIDDDGFYAGEPVDSVDLLQSDRDRQYDELNAEIEEAYQQDVADAEANQSVPVDTQREENFGNDEA